jgi:hypothetical protein
MVANLSRNDPAMLSVGDGGKTYIHLLTGSVRPMIFTSVIVVSQCHLVEAKTAGTGRTYKVIDGSLLAGEYERFVGAIGMILGVSEYRAQLYMDNLSFTTAFSSPENGESILFHHVYTITNCSEKLAPAAHPQSLVPSIAQLLLLL